MNDRFVSPCPPPTPFEAEVLVKIMEECAEVSQRCAKALRFGLDEVQPGQPDDNRKRLEGEIGDLSAMILIAEAAGILRPRLDVEEMNRRIARVQKYMQSEAPEGVF